MITILIPIFNAEKTLKRSLDSCFGQSFKDFEILAVNDQSTDNTQTILDQYKNPNLRVLNTKDINKKGIVAALNYGMDNAKGDFIARLDADDFMDPRRLELQYVEFAKNNELLLCATDARVVDEEGHVLQNFLVSADSIDELEFKCCIIHPSVMIRREFFDKNNLRYNSEFEYAEDYDLWMNLRTKATGNYYKHLSAPLLFYSVAGKDRISSNKSEEQKEKSKKIRQKYGIKPYLSIINEGDEGVLRKELQRSDMNYEIISSKDIPSGKYVAYSKYENMPGRFETQIQVLNKNSDLVGCGTYINLGNSSFFYSPDPNVIEAELLKGKIAVEHYTLLYKNNNKDYRNYSYFDMLCDLLHGGVLTNIQNPLVKIPDYKGTENSDFTNRIKKAKETYNDIVNIIHINITSEGNYSGVDRYLDTLESGYPSNIKCKRITFRASPNKLSFDFSNPNHLVIYYNTGRTQLEHLYDTIWDNISYMFLNKRNLIVQSNCFNLYTLLTYFRQKVAFKHICALHCVPYRELIRTDRDAYAKKEEEFLDERKEFQEIPWHYAAVNLADYAIVNTRDSEYYYNRVGYQPPYSIISNGIEKIGKGNRIYREGQEPFRFIFVGHSSPLKGFHQLIPIIEEVSRNHNIEIYWAGNCDPNMAQLIQQKKLPIKILGVVQPDELNKLYQQVDCALIATACETCSYAAIEALSAELPIIATRAHGVEEIVENVGLLINMNIRAEIDKDMYKNAMIKVITDSSLREQMSKRSAERFKLYSKENLINKSLELYGKLLNVSLGS